MMLLLGLRFLAEVGMLVCLAVGGWRLGDSTLLSLALSILLPLSAAMTWGRWVAPRAAHRWGDPARLAIEIGLFSAMLVIVLLTEPPAALMSGAVAVFGAFVVSIPARRHEPVPR